MPRKSGLRGQLHSDSDPVGTLTYDVHVEGSNNGKVQVSHLLNQVPEVISEAPFITPDTGSGNKMGPVTSCTTYSSIGVRRDH